MFTVRVADNFHYMDQDETYEHRTFDTWVEALAAARKIVDDGLREAYTAGATAEGLYFDFVNFGVDPYIIPTPSEEDFSAWEYAKHRCHEMCAVRDEEPDNE